MAISGPRASLGLFGGPGFIVALLIVLAGGGYIASQMMGGRVPGGGARLTLPGGGAPPAPMPATAHTGQETVSASEAASAALQTMPPLEQGAAPDPTAPAVPLPDIDLEWSPTDLLDEFPPDPALALSEIFDADAARAFRRPSSAPANAKRLALVATGMGRDTAATARAIVGAPAEVSLSFAPDSPDLADWIAAARAYGHEAMVDLHLDQGEALDGNSGERNLLAALGPAENLRRLDSILAEAPAIAGVTMHVADSFLRDAAALTPILDRLQSGGLVVVGLPVTAPLTIAADRTLESAATARDMLELKSLVRRQGTALVLASPEAALLLARSWTQPGGGADMPLVPASALVED